MEKIKDNTKEIASIPAITQELTSTRKKLKKGEYIEAVGRRKTAVARVRITPNDKSVFVVNGKPLGNYFTTDTLQTVVKNPIQQVNLDEKFSTSVIVKGGGCRRKQKQHDMESREPLLILIQNCVKISKRRDF